MNGKIIVITGTDGSGKETQTKLLYEFLKSKNINVEKQSFPNYDCQSAGPVKMYLGGEISKTANEIDAYQASTLFAVDRFCTMKSYDKFLKNGGILLLDRYMESNYIHQVGKIADKTEQQKFLKWLENFEFNILKIPAPNLIVFLDMPVEKSIELAHARASLKNGEKEDLHEKDANHLKTAYANGKNLAIKNGWKIISCVNENGKIKTIEAIQKELKKSVVNYLSQSNNKEL